MDKFPIMRFFASGHLPAHLQDVARPFEALAQQLIVQLGESTKAPAELAAGLRKLLEAKDCAVRAAL